jgi:hypothetical protein
VENRVSQRRDDGNRDVRQAQLTMRTLDNVDK